MLPIAILAGGLATRLRPVTATIPKALIDVEGEPFVAHQLRLLRSQGAERVVLCLGYRGEMVRDRVGDGSRLGLSVGYSFDGDKLLGTGGAIRRALPLLGGAFFVLYGDSYLPCALAEVKDAFESSGMPALMTVFRNDGQWDTSNVEFRDGRIAAYSKRTLTPAMHHIDYGLGVLTPGVFDAIEAEAFDLADLYEQLAREGRLAALEMHERFYEVGSFAGLAEFREHLKRKGGARSS
jgi:N-acetyl-alpha-D-muramate 1-phosphate uridylyltransferase